MGRSADDRIARLEKRLRLLEAREQDVPQKVAYTDEQIVEIMLIWFCYFSEGDEGRFIEHVVSKWGMPFEEAQETAGMLGQILEERRRTAPNPQCPV